MLNFVSEMWCKKWSIFLQAMGPKAAYTLLQESDLVAMYEEYKGRGVNGVLLWCYAADNETVAPCIPRKHSKSPDKNDNAPPSKYGKNLNK